MNDFCIQFISSLLATIFGGLILYFFLEKRVKEKIEEKERMDFLKNLEGDLEFNLRLIIDLIRREKELMESDKLPVVGYRLKGLTAFLYRKPLQEKEFPYDKLSDLIFRFTGMNTLTRLTFRLTQPKSIFENKKEIFRVAKRYMPEIEILLREVKSSSKAIPPKQARRG